MKIGVFFWGGDLVLGPAAEPFHALPPPPGVGCRVKIFSCVFYGRFSAVSPVRVSVAIEGGCSRGQGVMGLGGSGIMSYKTTS